MEHYETIWIEEIEKEVEVTISYYIENDGIGSYEAWGSPGYDKGTDYPVVEDWEFVCTDLTEQECIIVSNWLETNTEKLEQYVREKE